MPGLLTAALLSRLLSPALILATGLMAATPALPQQQQVVEIASREQLVLRALLLKPENPSASVVLLTGGHGNLSLDPDGRIGWGAGNQLVRTRANYAQAGFATLLPDIAPDLKQGSAGLLRYRWSPAHARDIGASVAFMRASPRRST